MRCLIDTRVRRALQVLSPGAAIWRVQLSALLLTRLLLLEIIEERTEQAKYVSHLFCGCLLHIEFIVLMYHAYDTHSCIIYFNPDLISALNMRIFLSIQLSDLHSKLKIGKLCQSRPQLHFVLVYHRIGIFWKLQVVDWFLDVLYACFPKVRWEHWYISLSYLQDKYEATASSNLA